MISRDRKTLDLFAWGEANAPKAPIAREPAMFSSSIMAGFECGYLGWNGHDLLVTTGHVPGEKMSTHYAIAAEHGMITARDGLPWRHDPARRMAEADKAGMQVIWDLNHYDPPPDPLSHARQCAQAADQSKALWLCPVNEPMLYPRLAGLGWEAATELAITMARVARDHHPLVKLLSTDPITGIGERQFAATDRLVSAGCVDVVGVNYYPHTARTSLLKVLVKTWKRYGKPILVSETSWHDGHREHHRRHPGFNKGAWFRHMRTDITAAVAQGVQIAGLCWYPIVDCPPWQHPQARSRWSHGLIRADLSVDPALSAELMMFHQAQAA